MSDKENPLEFSAKDLMPDWAQEKSTDQSKTKTSAKRFGGDDDGDKSQGRGGDRRGGGGGGGDRRGGGGQRGGQGGGGGQRGGGGQQGGYGGGGDRRGGQGNRFDDKRGGGRGDDRRGGDRRGGDRRGGDRRGGGDFERSRPEPLPAGISATLEPSQAAVNGLVKHIKETFRSFPVSDLAKMIIQERERYDIHFKAEAGKSKLFQCLADKSLWITKEEAVAHVLSGPAIEEYYTVEEVDIGAPAGNFSAIAVCGMSGTLLGPSNHHEYQKNIARLHQERFSNMSIDQLKSRIRMENDEETIEKWKEQVSKARHYRLKGDEEEVVEEPAAEVVVEPDSAETPSPETESEAAEVSETEVVETEETVEEELVVDPADGGEEKSKEVAEDSTEAASEEVLVEAPAQESVETPAPDELVLKSQEELAEHFREHFAGDVIAEVAEVLVPGNISGKNLSAGLLGYVKQEGEKLRRGFPLPMIQSLCREFEKHGMRFFKRGKKALHVSSIRPRAISASVSLSVEVQKIVDHVIANPGRKVVDMLDSLVDDFTKPDKAAPPGEFELSDGAKKTLGNLRWLTSEGYVLEFADTKLHIGKGPKPDQPAAKQPTKKAAKKKVARASEKTEGSAPALAETAETPVKATGSEVENTSSEVEPPEVKAAPAEEESKSDPNTAPSQLNKEKEAEAVSPAEASEIAAEATPEVDSAKAVEPEVAGTRAVTEPEVPATNSEEVEANETVTDETVTDPSIEAAPEETESKGE